jgi:plastocyanin
VTAVRRLPLLTAALALGAALVLAGCGGDDEGGGGADAAAPVTGVTQVAAKDNRFSPAAIQVPAGTEVTWTFKDGFIPHDVVGDGFSSGDPRRTGSFAHTFDRPGTYAYHCTVHDGMTGRVVVTAAG